MALENLNKPETNFLDPESAIDAEIIKRRQIYEDWVLLQKTSNPRLHIDEESDCSWGINTQIIVRNLPNQDLLQLRVFPASDPFLYTIQEYLIEVMDIRNLFFSSQHAHAIAAPDEVDEKPQRLIFRYIIQIQDRGYDLLLPLTLTRQVDKGIYDFFFALKMKQVPPLNMDSFLQYQCDTNFNCDRSQLSRYLLALIEQYGNDAQFKFLNTESFRARLGAWLVLTTSEEQPIVTEEIEGVLHPERIKKILYYFGNIPNSKQSTVLHQEDVAILQKFGFSYPPKYLQNTITVRLSASERRILYQFFYWVWLHHTQHNKGKIKFARYIQEWFDFGKGRTPLVISKQLKEPSFKQNEEWNEALFPEKNQYTNKNLSNE